MDEDISKQGFWQRKTKLPATVTRAWDLIRLSNRPAPKVNADGSYVDKDIYTGLLEDLPHLRPRDAATVLELLKDGLSGQPLNDRAYTLEGLVQLASELPTRSRTRDLLTGNIIQVLWSDLQHPPATYLNQDQRYREPDGSNNNIMSPTLGAANSPYARSVVPLKIQPTARPDPGLLFDSIMVRKNFQRHPNNISSMLFYLASIIIHDLFRTSHDNFGISETSSYLDLAPLYGSNMKEQQAMRTFKDGRLLSDCFSEKRILGFPPGVGALLVLFNRFHNFVVEELATINEEGRFNKPKVANDFAAWKKYDNDLFQTGRLVVCGLYINIILYDYVRTILNLNRTTSDWNLDPRGKSENLLGIPEKFHPIGNQVSAEFNLIYRWHAAISERDDKWTQDLYKRLFPNKGFRDLSIPEFLKALSAMENELPANPQDRSFGDLVRDADGNFNDDALAEILVSGIEDPAGAFAAQNIPEVLRIVEILGIQQARTWKMATLNEFRNFFNLTPHETFEDISTTPEVASMLRQMYDRPDLVEMYPGVVVEDGKKPLKPGSGLAPNFTISRAILSDAVALVRSDRFYTVDNTPSNLTNWGFSEVRYDTKIEEGIVLWKLFLHALPRNFKPNSVYAHYPFTIPSENKKILKDLGRAQRYDFGRPTRLSKDIIVTDFAACKTIIEDFATFHPAMSVKLRTQILRPVELQHSQAMQQGIGSFFKDTTERLLKEKSTRMGGQRIVDIIRDVCTVTGVLFLSNVFCIPLKTPRREGGILTEYEVLHVLNANFLETFLDFRPAKSFQMGYGTADKARALTELVKLNVFSVHNKYAFPSHIEKLAKSTTSLKEYGKWVIVRIMERVEADPEATWNLLLPLMAAFVSTQAQIIAQVVDFYMSVADMVYLEELNRLSEQEGKKADDLVYRYIVEALRITGAYNAFRTTKSPTTLSIDGNPRHFESGQRVFVNGAQSMMNQNIFRGPGLVKLDRDMKLYFNGKATLYPTFDDEVYKMSLIAQFKAICRLKKLRRVPGPQGQLKEIRKPGVPLQYMNADWTDYSPLPDSFKVMWNEN